MPAPIRQSEALDLPEALSETEALAALRDLAAGNEVFTSLIGTGYSDSITPPVILRNVLENPGWYTAYTPYQPEISQAGWRPPQLPDHGLGPHRYGAVQRLPLDEATAAAEAMALCRRVSSSTSAAFFVDADCHPQTIDVVQTRAEPLDIKVIVGDPRRDLAGTDVYGVLPVPRLQRRSTTTGSWWPKSMHGAGW